MTWRTRPWQGFLWKEIMNNCLDECENHPGDCPKKRWRRGSQHFVGLLCARHCILPLIIFVKTYEACPNFMGDKNEAQMA